jgi:hypothetical protein
MFSPKSMSNLGRLTVLQYSNAYNYLIIFLPQITLMRSFPSTKNMMQYYCTMVYISTNNLDRRPLLKLSYLASLITLFSPFDQRRLLWLLVAD